MGSTWRDRARPMIAEVLADLPPDMPVREKAKIARRAIPAQWEGPYHPQRIWNHEVRVQLGLVEFPRRPKPTPDPANQQRFDFQPGPSDG